MRRSAFLLFILLPLSSFSQVNFINRSLTDSSLKIVYSGVGNIIEIKNFTFTKTTSIGISNAEIIPLDKNKIKITPKYGFKECVVSAENHAASEEFKQVFRIDSLVGDVVIRLAGVKDSIASIHQILANPFLISELPGSYFKTPLNITSFTATFIGASLDSLKTNAMENLFTKEQIDLIERLRRGDKILFEETYFFWPDGRRRKYPPFTIKIN